MKIPGIQLAYPYSKLYEVNFPNLLDQVGKDLQNMQKTQLSWVGKIAAFKMQIFRIKLYYFRSPPIPIHVKLVLQINVKLKNVIWNGKEPKVVFSILTITKPEGGTGLPDINQ